MSPAAGGSGAWDPGTGAEVHIDRLALRVAGLDEDAARALARQLTRRGESLVAPRIIHFLDR